MADISNEMNQIDSMKKEIEDLKVIIMHVSEKLDRANKGSATTDDSTINELKASINKLSNELSLKANSGDLKKLRDEVSTKADKDATEKAISLKASSKSVNELNNKLDSKADSNSVTKALSLKADVKTVSNIEKELEEKANRSDVSSLEFKMTNSALKSSPAVKSSLSPEMVKSAVEQYATETLVNILRGYVNEQLALKASQNDFEQIVGNGFQGWTITDYIIRIREDYNRALADMATKTEFSEAVDAAAESFGNMLQVGDEAGESTKLYFDIDDIDQADEVTLATMTDLTNEFNKIGKFFKFNIKSTFEAGGLDEHGWNETDAKKARTTGYINARDFSMTLPSAYKMKVVSYDSYKLLLGVSNYLTGVISFDVDGTAGTEYIKLLVERADAADISSSDLTTLSNISISMFGTDATGVNTDSSASVEFVNTKISKSQGVVNAGKVLTVGADGNVVLAASGLSDALKQAILDCFADVAWATDQGATKVAALRTALNVTDTFSDSTVARSMKITPMKKDILEGEEVAEGLGSSNKVQTLDDWITEEDIEETDEELEEVKPIVYSLGNNDFDLVSLTLGNGLSLTQTLAENTRKSAVMDISDLKYDNEDYCAIPVPSYSSTVTVTADSTDIDISLVGFDTNGERKVEVKDYPGGTVTMDLSGSAYLWVGLRKASGLAFEDGDIENLTISFE